MMTIYLSGAIVLVASFILSPIFFGNMKAAICIIVGILVGIAIGFLSEVFTSEKYSQVKRIAEESQTGAATNIIAGLSSGMLSTVGPIVLIAIGILV